MAETPYAETEVLVAVMNGDHARAKELLADFLPGELRMFHRQVSDLWEITREETRSRDDD